jgi:hypothetical protein
VVIGNGEKDADGEKDANGEKDTNKERDKEVLCIGWQDNNIVTMLSTVHTVHKESDLVSCKRKRPGPRSTNANIARKPFGDKPVKELKIPKIMDNYNHHMGGIDIANQYRASYHTQRRSLHNWWPLFYWILNTAINNAYILQCTWRKERKEKLQESLDFRHNLLENLLNWIPNQESETAYQLAKHQQKQSTGLHPCAWCKHIRASQMPLQQISDSQLNARWTKQTRYQCKECNVSLCQREDLMGIENDCWNQYHRNLTR